MTESRIKEYKDSELEQLFKQVEKTLIADKKLKEAVDEQYYILRTGGSIGTSDMALGPYSHDDAIEKAKRYRKLLTPGEKGYYGIKYKVISQTEYDRLVRQGRLKEAEEDQEDDQLEQKIKDWVTSTIDGWRRDWDDSPEGAYDAKHDLETAADWFWDNLADFEDKYDYIVEEDDKRFDDCLNETVDSYVEETLQNLRDSWDHFDDEYEDDDVWDPDEEDNDDEYWDEVHASDRYFNESKLKEAGEVTQEITPEDIVNDYLGKHPEAKAQGPQLLQQLKTIQQKNPNADLNSEFEKLLHPSQQQPVKSKPEPVSTESTNALSNQDIKLGQGYLMKALNTGDISNQINQLLPKISPTFKGNKFQVTKVEPMAIDQKDPNSMKFKVSFNLVSGSEQADKLVASQDPTINHARQFLNSLQEEQLNEGLAGAIGKAVGNVAGAIKRGAQNVAAGFANANQANISPEYIQMAANKEPLLQQYLPKILNQAFTDDLNINGKQFQVTIPKIALKKDSNALKTLQKDTTKDKAGNKTKDQAQAKEQAPTEDQAQAKDQKVKDKPQQPGDQGQNVKESQHKSSLYTRSETRFNEGSVVKGGSFILDLTLAGNASSGANTGLNQQFATPDTQSQQGSQQIQQTQQPQAAPVGQSINIYNGTPQQGQQQVAQNNGTPFWYNDMSKRQRKKFVRNQLKNPRQAKASGAPGQNNLWGMTYDNGGKYGSKFA